MSLEEGTDGGRDALADALEAAGHPVIRISVADPIDLAGEFVRWEVAVAIAGIVLGIDPFDQPNVEEAKQLTRDVLAKAERGEPMTSNVPAVRTDEADLAGQLRDHLARRKPNAYLALQAFIAPTPARDEAMSRIRRRLRDATRNATTARLRAALPPLDRPAAQGRTSDRLVPAIHRDHPRIARSRGGRTPSVD
jgi:transaldolase/glucose-6-phosphate isomerase